MLRLYIKSLLFILILCHSLYGQNNSYEYGVISGKIVDKELGNPLQYTAILINGSFINNTSDKDGNFKIDSLPEGKYTIEFRYIGYEHKVLENIELKKGEIKELFITLIPDPGRETCYEKYYNGIKESFLNFKKGCEKAFNIKKIEELPDVFRIFVLPSFQWEYLIEMRRNDSEYTIKLYIVDSTDINISMDMNEIHYTDSTGKERIKPCDADYSVNGFPEFIYQNYGTFEEMDSKDYFPTVRVNNYDYCNKDFYRLIFSTFDLMRIDTMKSIEYCNMSFNDGTDIIVETNINNRLNEFMFTVDLGYNDKRYVWISNLAEELKRILKISGTKKL